MPAVHDHQVLHVIRVGAEHTQPTHRTHCRAVHVETLGSRLDPPAQERVAVRNQDLLAALLQGDLEVVIPQNLNKTRSEARNLQPWLNPLNQYGVMGVYYEI